MVPDELPALKKCLTTSCPAPISANVPYINLFRFILRALASIDGLFSSSVSPGKFTVILRIINISNLQRLYN